MRFSPSQNGDVVVPGIINKEPSTKSRAKDCVASSHIKCPRNERCSFPSAMRPVGRLCSERENPRPKMRYFKARYSSEKHGGKVGCNKKYYYIIPPRLEHARPCCYLCLARHTLRLNEGTPNRHGFVNGEVGLNFPPRIQKHTVAHRKSCHFPLCRPFLYTRSGINTLPNLETVGSRQPSQPTVDKYLSFLT